LTEESQYTEIFTALKHPVRRQILLFIDNKGEASFTEIQQETGITDTGLMSYHLKGLAPLIEQSKRGKYQLSEVGQAGVELLRKVNHEKERTSTVIHEEIEQFIGSSIKKSVLFLLIAGWTMLVPMLMDSYFSVNAMRVNGYSTVEVATIFLGTLAVMVGGVFLFTLYDRHYYSKTTKSSILHSLLFTFVCSVLSILFFNSLNNFNQFAAGSSQMFTSYTSWTIEILKIIIFNTSAPAIAYGLNRYSYRENKIRS
jgi:DNA-binding transcriptional ArsR family regulator